MHPARVPKMKHAVHMLSSLAYLLLLGVAVGPALSYSAIIQYTESLA